MPALTLAAAVAAVLAAWLALAAVLLGLGLLVPLGFPRGRWDAGRLSATAWVGWAVALALLQAWHLAWPVAPWALPALALLGVAGLLARGAGLPGALRDGVRRRPRVAAAAALLALWLADRALGPPVGDAGLYHLTGIRWAASYPAVPGLANLVRQLGVNGPALLWPAALEVGPFWGRSSHLAAGLLVALTGARAVAALGRCLGPAGGARPVDLFAAALLPAVVGHAVTLHELRLSSPDPDTLAGLAALAAATEAAAWLTAEGEAGPHRLAALILATLTALLKPSLAPFGGLLVLALLARPPGPAGRRAPGAWLALAALLALPWLARGALLAGDPLFPSGLLPLPVDWRFPEADRRALVADIAGSLPPVVGELRRAGEGWARPWLVWQATRSPELALLPAALLLLGLAAGRGAAPGPARRARWLLAPGLAGAAAWLAAAPHPRLAYGVLWACAAAALTAGLGGGLAAAGPRRRLALAILVGAPLLPALHRVAAWTWRGEPARAVEALVLGPGPDAGFHPSPAAALAPCTTRSGLVVSVPVGDDKPWDAPLPAAIRCDPGLELRRPGDLGGGFRLAR